MSPTFLRIGPYRFFFNSREERRCHVHVSAAGGNAKFWLEPTIALAGYHHLDAHIVRQIDILVREHADEIRTAWDKHFNQ